MSEIDVMGINKNKLIQQCALLHNYYVPGSVLTYSDTLMSQTDRVSVFHLTRFSLQTNLKNSVNRLDLDIFVEYLHNKLVCKLWFGFTKTR